MGWNPSESKDLGGGFRLWKQEGEGPEMGKSLGCWGKNSIKKPGVAGGRMHGDGKGMTLGSQAGAGRHVIGRVFDPKCDERPLRVLAKRRCALIVFQT